jgi:hypothetical protein
MRAIVRSAGFPGFTTAMDGGSVAIGTTARDAGGRATQEQLPREPMRPTTMDGGRDCSRQSSAFPPSMEVRSAGAAGSGSSKNLEGLIGSKRPIYGCYFSCLS